MASVNWWMMVAENSKLPSSGMSFPDMITIPDNLNSVSVQNRFGPWNATTEEEKLLFFYTQWWLDAFRQPWEAYALARRTGQTPHEKVIRLHITGYPIRLRKLNIIVLIGPKQ